MLRIARPSQARSSQRSLLSFVTAMPALSKRHPRRGGTHRAGKPGF